MLDIQAAQVEDMLMGEVRALAPILRQARAELAREIRAWTKTLAPGDSWTKQHKRNAMAMLNRLDREMRAIMTPAMRRALGNAGDKAMAMSAADLNEQLAYFGALFEGSIHPVSVREAGIIAHGRRTLVPQFASSAARYAGDSFEQIRKQISLGFLQNESFEQMTRRLIRIGGPTGRVALVGISGMPGAHVETITDGLFARYPYYAERLVRTEGINAYNVVHQRGLVEANREDPEIQMRWDASADRRRCAICADLDGKIVDVAETFTTDLLPPEKRTKRHPPAHPNCRCTLTPWKAAWSAYGLLHLQAA
jgi:SPP1 gp7 family putative phage head morphogenesis protein